MHLLKTGVTHIGNDKKRLALCCLEFVNSRILRFSKNLNHTDLIEAALPESPLWFSRRLTSRKFSPVIIRGKKGTLLVSIVTKNMSPYPALL